MLSLAGKADAALSVGEELVCALGLLDAPARRAGAQLCVARAAVSACRWATADRHLAEVRRHAETTADHGLAARVDVLAAQGAIGRGDPDAAIQMAAISMAEAGFAAAERLGAHELACEALEVIGRCARVRDLDESERAFERALLIAESHELVVWRVRALAELGTGLPKGQPTQRVRVASASGSVGSPIRPIFGEYYKCRQSQQMRIRDGVRSRSTVGR